MNGSERNQPWWVSTPLRASATSLRWKILSPPHERSGIYSLACSCGDRYIMQTGRSFNSRLDEHKRDYLSYFKPPRFKKTPKKTQSPNPGSNPLTPGRSATPNKSPFARPKTFKSDSAMARHCWTSGHDYNAVTPSSFTLVWKAPP